jgi:hypothetical protein
LAPLARRLKDIRLRSVCTTLSRRVSVRALWSGISLRSRRAEFRGIVTLVDVTMPVELLDFEASSAKKPSLAPPRSGLRLEFSDDPVKMGAGNRVWVESPRQERQDPSAERPLCRDQGAARGFVIVTTRGLRMAWHAEGQSVAKPRGRATRPARPSVSVCKPRGSRDDALG